MIERLTEKVFDNNGKQQDIYEWSSASSLECNKKLGMLEDIMEKYSIENVEELEFVVDKGKRYASLSASMYDIIKSRDAWKEACKLALKEGYYAEKEYYIGEPPTQEEYVRKQSNYFYQQAKTEGNDEN